MKTRLTSKAIALTLALTLLGAGLAGCTPTQAEEPEHEPITILTGQQNYGAFVELLKERYPEVELEFLTFSGGAASSYMQESLERGDIPDIYTITYVPDNELQAQWLLDLSTYSVVNEYPSTVLDSLNVGGGLYLLPSRYNLVGIVYNKTLMEEHDWAVPQSFEELLALAPQIQAAGYRVADMTSYLTGTTFGAFFALGNTNYFNTPQGAQWKKDFLRGEAKAVGSLEGVCAYVQEWIDAGFLTTLYYDDHSMNANDDFDTRQYVFQLYSNRLSGNTEDQFGFMPFLSRDGSDNMLVRLVSRYYGLSKELGEPGNEQKLADALKVFDLMATQEGQDALSGGNLAQIPSTSINELPQGSPYEDVLPLINSGSMVDMVYAGWENHIVPLIENYGNDWLRGTLSSDGFLAGMDALNEELLAGTTQKKLATATQDIGLEDAARLCAMAQGAAVDADAALIAMPGFHGFSDSGSNLENRRGVHSGFYAGEVTEETVAIFAPSGGTILTVRLTGAEIKALAAAGFLVEGDPTPFEYRLVTRGGMELEDGTEYTLAVGSTELSDTDIQAMAQDSGVAPRDAVTRYVAALGVISPESILWEGV